MKMPGRVLVSTAFFALLSLAAFAQKPSPGFEAADIHPSQFSFYRTYFHPGVITGDRYTLRQATMLDLVQAAYKLDADSVQGGPPWLEFDRYDIIAKIPRGTSQDDARMMLRALLADRFKLVVRTEIKPLPAFLLKMGKGAPKLSPAANADMDPVCGENLLQSPPSSTGLPSPPMITMRCHNVTMEKFAFYIGGLRSNLAHPVVDATGLKGGWDFEIHFSLQQVGPDGITVPDAVEKQLGLKLELGTSPGPATFIVSVNERPTDNPPGLEKILPPPAPLAFEVAVIKPHNLDSTAPAFRSNAGQFAISGTLQELMSQAWDISGATIANAPDFYTKRRWDILGKLPAGTSLAGAGRIEEDQLNQMLQGLLIERFHLKVHHEMLPGDAYTLIAVNPKMKTADPANRTSCNSNPAPDAKDPRIANPLINRIMTCRNITMDQFANEVMQYARYYIKTPVLNGTKLKGNYDINLYFSDTSAVRSTPATAGGAADNGASEPNGAIPLPDALAKLGLKLEMQKRPVPMLVVDHLDEMPTDN
jgi:uncharacterized protein (TIGR03435 family)